MIVVIMSINSKISVKEVLVIYNMMFIMLVMSLGWLKILVKIIKKIELIKLMV